MKKNKTKHNFYFTFVLSALFILCGAVLIFSSASNNTVYAATGTVPLLASLADPNASNRLDTVDGNGEGNSLGTAFKRTPIEVATVEEKSAYKMGLLFWHITVPQKHIAFTAPLTPDDIAKVKSVTINFYADFSNGEYVVPGNWTGVYLYGLDSKGGAGEGYKFNSGVKQREWSALTLTPSQLTPLLDKDGYFRGIKVAAGDNGFNGFKYDQDAFNQNGIIVPLSYLAIGEITADYFSEADYKPYLGAYYNESGDTLYMLNEGSKAVKVTKGSASDVSFSITGSGILSIEDEEYMIDAIRFVSASSGGVFYKLFNEYTIFMYADGAGGDAVIVTVGAADNYILPSPEDPVRDGYNFKGWQLGNGADYDFNSIVAGTVSLYAKWERANPAAQPKKGCGSVSGIFAGGNLIPFVFTAFSLLLLAVFLKKKKYLRTEAKADEHKSIY